MLCASYHAVFQKASKIAFQMKMKKTWKLWRVMVSYRVGRNTTNRYPPPKQERTKEIKDKHTKADKQKTKKNQGWLHLDTNLSLMSSGPTYSSIRLSKNAPSIANIVAGTRNWFILTSRFFWGRDRASTLRNRPIRNKVEMPRATYFAASQAKYGESSISSLSFAVTAQ